MTNYAVEWLLRSGGCSSLAAGTSNALHESGVLLRVLQGNSRLRDRKRKTGRVGRLLVLDCDLAFHRRVNAAMVGVGPRTGEGVGVGLSVREPRGTELTARIARHGVLHGVLVRPDDRVTGLDGHVAEAEVADVGVDRLRDRAAKKELRELIERAADYYGKVLDTYHKHNKLVKFVFSEYADFETSIDDFRTKNNQLWAPVLAEYLKILIFKIKETEFIMISMENAPK